MKNMEPCFKVGQRVLCVEGFNELRCGDYYTIREVFDIICGYTYELEEFADTYWKHERFIEAGCA